MHPVIRDLLARQLQTGGADIRGATADVRIPLREAILNEVLTATVLPAYPSLRRLSVTIRADNHVDVTAASSQFAFLPSVTARLDVDPEVRGFPVPVDRLRVRREGVSGLLSPILAMMAKRAPAGVRIDSGLIEINLADLLRGTPAERYVRMFRGARLESEAGVLWIKASFGVD